MVLGALGDELRDRGDLLGAHRLLTEAVRVGREIDQRNSTFKALTHLASLEADEGDLRGAAAHCREAVAMSREMSKRHEALANLTCARIAIEQGRLEEAERLALSAANGEESQQLSPTESYHVLSRDLADGSSPRRAAPSTAWWRPACDVSRFDTPPTARSAPPTPADAVTALRAVVDEAMSTGYLRPLRGAFIRAGRAPANQRTPRARVWSA